MGKYGWISKQAGAELGQAQLKLELGFTSTKIWGITLMIPRGWVGEGNNQD